MPQVGVSLDDQTKIKIQALADLNKRSFSQMAGILASAALNWLERPYQLPQSRSHGPAKTMAQELNIMMPIPEINGNVKS